MGVNQVGYEADNEQMCDGPDLPWLQEDAEHLVWGLWEVTYRDIWVLDADNELVGIFNLTGNSLGEAGNYETLRGLFEQASR